MAVAVAQRSINTLASGTSWTVPLPNTGAATGDVYLIFVSSDSLSVTQSTSSSGWSQISTYGDTTHGKVGLYFGVVGTASTSLVVSPSSSTSAEYAAFRLTGANQSTSGVSVSTGTGNSGTHTFPALTPAQGNINYQWFLIDVATSTASFTSYSPPSAPSGWSNYQSQASTNNITSAEQNLTASSMASGNWPAASFTTNYLCLTVAVSGAVNVSATDTTTATDSVKLGISATGDPVSGTDSASVNATTTGTETATATESAKVLMVAADSVTVTESSQLTLTAAEAVSGTEATPMLTLATSDGLSASEAQQIADLYQVLDTITASELAQLVIAVADPEVVTDFADTVGSLLLSGFDSISATESAVIATLVGVSESISASESAKVLIQGAEALNLFEYASIRENGRIRGERVYYVPAEDRTYTVPYEKRTFVVDPENRTYKVPYEKRVYQVPEEKRTYG